MTTIQSATNSAAATTGQTNATTASSKPTMGQDDFFKLMIAQLQNQDPTKPVDGQQQLAQLAQFSTLQSIQNLQVSFDKLAEELKPASTTSSGSSAGQSSATV
ncbi:flagellar hook capping FlgD N-terminal domain-containing protein [Candidatus Contendibacter odensensis]|uniref:Basal-body rod modification protein FlgD n=1 Tax=Candidatus Contendobacter odensis Run_B_J11 TaxID=1400861 RepID=A0A7U7G951_9GAMM|nr:flagellar hook capping FlgD N-terminal domain-containing protein [Candidatus Contendobacter odensis]CDH43775.1 putative flgD domain protein [Candidatus Contendobacter odensis Run_B_J11]